MSKLQIAVVIALFKIIIDIVVLYFVFVPKEKEISEEEAYRYMSPQERHEKYTEPPVYMESSFPLANSEAKITPFLSHGVQCYETWVTSPTDSIITSITNASRYQLSNNMIHVYHGDTITTYYGVDTLLAQGNPLKKGDPISIAKMRGEYAVQIEVFINQTRINPKELLE